MHVNTADNSPFSLWMTKVFWTYKTHATQKHEFYKDSVKKQKAWDLTAKVLDERLDMGWQDKPPPLEAKVRGAHQRCRDYVN